MHYIFTLLLTLVILSGCNTDNMGGVLTANELPESVVSYIHEKKILKDESLIAYYDFTITLNNSESVILTDKNIIHFKSGKINRIPHSMIESISDIDQCFGVCFLITSSDSKIMRIEIAPLNGGDLFLQILENQILKYKINNSY